MIYLFTYLLVSYIDHFLSNLLFIIFFLNVFKSLPRQEMEMKQFQRRSEIWHTSTSENFTVWASKTIWTLKMIPDSWRNSH